MFTLDAAHESAFADDLQLSSEWFDMNSIFDKSIFGSDGFFGVGFQSVDSAISHSIPSDAPIEVFDVESFLVADPSFIMDNILLNSHIIDHISDHEDAILHAPLEMDIPLERVIEPEPRLKRKMVVEKPYLAKRSKGRYMEPFPAQRVVHWKYVLYNLLVENYNSDDKNTLVMPCEVTVKGKIVKGFSLNQALDPKKRLAELYSLYVRKEDLASEDYSSPFIQDLYKYYLRCALQLMNKFFIKAGPWTYLYDEIILFVVEEDLASAEMRLRFLEGKKKKRGSE